MPCGSMRCNSDIDGRQCVLVQAKRFSRQALDTIARNGGSAGARRYGQAEPRMSFMVRQNGQAKVRVGKSSAALPYCAKFGRLVQTLARLERQFTDR
jgi:hypothetical protein